MSVLAGNGAGTLAVDGDAWRLSGALTFRDAGAVFRASERAALPANGIVDLGELVRVDSAALALLLAWKRRAATERTALTFTGAPPAIATLARVYDIEGLLAV